MVEEIDRCYKIHFDSEGVSLQKMFEKLSEISSVTLYNKEVYVWLKDDINSNKLKNVLKKCGINDFFCEKIKESDVSQRKDYIATWFVDHYSVYMLRQFERNNQEMLKKARENISKFREELQKKEGGLNG